MGKRCPNPACGADNGYRARKCCECGEEPDAWKKKEPPPPPSPPRDEKGGRLRGAALRARQEKERAAKRAAEEAEAKAAEANEIPEEEALVGARNGFDATFLVALDAQASALLALRDEGTRRTLLMSGLYSAIAAAKPAAIPREVADHVGEARLIVDSKVLLQLDVEDAADLFSELLKLLLGTDRQDLLCLGVEKDASHGIKRRFLNKRDASATSAASLALGATLLDADEGFVKSTMAAIQRAAPPKYRIGDDASIPARPSLEYAPPEEQFTTPELMDMVARALSKTTSSDAKAEKGRCIFDGAVSRACDLLPKTCLASREASSVSDALVAFLREIRDAQPLVAPLEDRLDTCRAAAAALVEAMGLFGESDLPEDYDWDVPLDDLRDEDYELDAKTSSGFGGFVKRSKLEKLRDARFVEGLKARPDMRLTAVRNRMGAAAAAPHVAAPKTRQSIRLDEVRRLADARAQQLGYFR